MNWITELPVVERIGWTLLHFIWQGALISTLYAILILLVKKSVPNTRYIAGCISLCVMMGCAVYTFSFVRVSAESITAFDNPYQHNEIKTDTQATQHNELTNKTVITATIDNPVEASQTTSWEFSTHLLKPYLPWLAGIWFAGVLLLSVRLVGGWVITQQLRHKYVEPVTEQCQMMLQHVMKQMRVHQTVDCLESQLVLSPITFGWIKPLILIPACTVSGLSEQQLKAILAHELAHIKRNDYLVNIVQSVIETLLFFHPGVWWVSSCIRQEREHCCDDAAVKIMGDRCVYAQALAGLETIRHDRLQLVLAANGNSLLQRVQRLASFDSTIKQNRANTISAIISFTVLVTIILSSSIMFYPQNGFAKDIAGTVLFNGKPVEGASVSYNSVLHPVYYDTTKPERFGFLTNNDKPAISQTNQNGTFTLTNVKDAPFTLCAYHDEYGFTILPDFEFEKNASVTLKPWGRVEGDLLYDEQSTDFENSLISITQPYQHKQFFDWYVRTYQIKDNHFVIDKVPAGSSSLTVQSLSFFHYSDYFNTPQDGSITVNIDLRKVDVKGKITVPGRTNWEFDSNEFNLFYFDSHLPYPASLRTELDERQWLWKWLHTQEGQSAIQDSHKNFSGQIDSLGNFILRGVKPGNYTLRYENTITRQKNGGWIASIYKDVTIPKNVNTFDMGEIEVKSETPIAVASVAPKLKAIDIEGKEVSTESLKGKVVLLHFWNPSHLPNLQSIPEMKQLYNKYKNKDFALIYISSNSNKYKIQSIIEEFQILWQQLDIDYRHPVMRDYQSPPYSTSFLLDQQGIVIKQGLLEIEELDNLIAEALQK